MEDEELPSESTARPSFRRNVLKNTTSINTNLLLDSAAKVDRKKLKSTSAATKKRSSRLAKQSISRKKTPARHSTPKSKAKKSIIGINSSSTDDDMYEDHDQSTNQELPSDRSAAHQADIQGDENLTDLNGSFASDITDTNDPDNQPNTLSKTTARTKQDVLGYFTKQANGEFKCNLCTNTPKVI